MCQVFVGGDELILNLSALYFFNHRLPAALCFFFSTSCPAPPWPFLPRWGFRGGASALAGGLFTTNASTEFSHSDDISSAALSQHHLLGFEKSSAGIPSPPLALFVVMLPKAHLTSHSRTSGSK